MQAVLHFVVIGMAELFPLYASSPTGLRLREHEVGLALAPLAVSLFTWPFVYVVLERRYGARATLRLGWCAFLVVNLILPQLHVLREAPALLWPCLVAVGLVRGVGGNSSFPSISLLLNSLLTENLGAHREACMGSRAAEAPAQGRAHTARTVHPQGQPTHAPTKHPPHMALRRGLCTMPPQHALLHGTGAMNGFALSVASLSRATSPLLCGSLFSAATARGESPLEALPFYLLCVLCLLGLWLTTFLPPRATQWTGGAPPVGNGVCR